MEKKLSELLSQVHLYYPIGMNNLSEEYLGQQTFLKILESKIDSIMEGVPMPWTHVIQRLKSEFKDSTVFDYAGCQFPCFYALVELEKWSKSKIAYTKSLVINISLLTNHYTIFFEDFYKFIDYRINYETTSDTPSKIIAYSKSARENAFVDQIEIIKREIERQYPTYNFLGHDLLLNHFVYGGNKFGSLSGWDDKYSLYEYLFQNNLDRNKMIVLQ